MALQRYRIQSTPESTLTRAGLRSSDAEISLLAEILNDGIDFVVQIDARDLDDLNEEASHQAGRHLLGTAHARSPSELRVKAAAVSNLIIQKQVDQQVEAHEFGRE